MELREAAGERSGAETEAADNTKLFMWQEQVKRFKDLKCMNNHLIYHSFEKNMKELHKIW